MLRLMINGTVCVKALCIIHARALTMINID